MSQLSKSQETAVDILCDLFPNSRSKLLVLDVGMGNGRLAEQMLNSGFYLIDVVENSGQAVTEAKRRSLYDKYYKCSISNNNCLPIPDGMYDIVVSMEDFCGRTTPCEALRELVRVCKPGGVVVIAVREIHLRTDVENIDSLQPAMMDLQTEGFWELLVREIVPEFSDGDDKTKILYVFKTCGRR